MKVSDVMTRDVHLANPKQTLREAARMMSEQEIGALPVGEGDRLVGMITDRDIVIRGVAAGKGPSAKVGDIMSDKVMYCFDDEDTDNVCQNMAEIQMRRLPVVNREKRLVGILALPDLATTGDGGAAAALEGISQPV
jgi:CBS domain-containing protein